MLLEHPAVPAASDLSWTRTGAEAGLLHGPVPSALCRPEQASTVHARVDVNVPQKEPSPIHGQCWQQPVPLSDCRSHLRTCLQPCSGPRSEISLCSGCGPSQLTPIDNASHAGGQPSAADGAAWRGADLLQERSIMRPNSRSIHLLRHQVPHRSSIPAQQHFMLAPGRQLRTWPGVHDKPPLERSPMHLHGACRHMLSIAGALASPLSAA